MSQQPSKKALEILSGRVIQLLIQSYDSLAEALSLEYQAIQSYSEEDLINHFRRKDEVIAAIESTCITRPLTKQNAIADFEQANNDLFNGNEYGTDDTN